MLIKHMSTHIFNKRDIRRKVSENQKTSTQPAITCAKLTTETLEQGVKYVYTV